MNPRPYHLLIRGDNCVLEQGQAICLPPALFTTPHSSTLTALG
jgi:hypothetical protein